MTERRRKRGGLSGDAAADTEEAETHSAQTGIQSVESGMELLSAIARLTTVGPPPMLKTLAAEAGMLPAKAHRYIVSFIRSGAVERDPATGRYRLGAMARQIGIAALKSLDVVRFANTRLSQVRDELQQTVALAIWAYHGPTIIAVDEVRRPVMVSTRVGEVMPLLTSATGRVYGAWYPRSATRALLDQELATRRKARGGRIATRAAADALFNEIRVAGVGYVNGGLNPAISALSAPIFDYRGALVAALSSLGPSREFDTSPTGRLARALRTAADAISAELGYDPRARE